MTPIFITATVSQSTSSTSNGAKHPQKAGTTLTSSLMAWSMYTASQLSNNIHKTEMVLSLHAYLLDLYSLAFVKVIKFVEGSWSVLCCIWLESITMRGNKGCRGSWSDFVDHFHQGDIHSVYKFIALSVEWSCWRAEHHHFLPSSSSVYLPASASGMRMEQFLKNWKLCSSVRGGRM